MWRSILRIGILLALSVLLAFGAERFFFNRLALSGTSGPDAASQPSITLSAETLYPNSQGFALENGRLRSISDQATIELAIPGGKIRQVILSYQSATDADIYIRSTEPPQTDEPSATLSEADLWIADQAPRDLQQAATVVEAEVEQVTLVVPDAGFILDAVTLDRSVAIHPQRTSFLAIGLFLLGLLLSGSLPFLSTPTHWFLLLGASLGVWMMVLSPLQFLGWDEQIHFKSMLVRSFPDVAWLTPAAQRLVDLDLPPADTRFDQLQTAAWLSQLDEPSLATPAVQEKSWGVHHVPYLPGILAFALSRWLGSSLSSAILLARILSLIIYLSLTAWAIHLMPFGKHLLAVYALLPTLLFQATRLTYDTVTIAAAFLFLAALLDEWANPDRLLSKGRLILFTAAALVFNSIKSVYVPLVAAAYFIPSSKFISEKKRLMYWIFLTVLIALILSQVILPGLLQPDPGGDARVSGTSVSGQLAFIFAQPIAAARIILGDLIANLGTFLLGNTAVLSYAYAGTIHSANWSMAIAVLLVILALMDQPNRDQDGLSRPALPLSQSLYLAATALISLVLVYLALYISFTPVGALAVDGVQPRYIFPLALPLLLLLRRPGIQHTLQPATLARLTFLPVILVNLFGLYQHFLVPFYR
ncbi:MAG: DUF2142 domain-containing protein [Clostridia bacterium]|nr:DUF2142 domain-containing protein [Clostridia bacterium]